MVNLETKIVQTINTVESEFRILILNALRMCNGEISKFQDELESLAWDYPDFDCDQYMLHLNS